MNKLKLILTDAILFFVALVAINILTRDSVDIVATLFISAVAAIVKFFVMKLA